MKDIGLCGFADYRKAERANATVALIQALISLGLQAASAALQAEVTRLAGPGHSRSGGIPKYGRWGHQRGSIYLADQKLPIPCPPLRDPPPNQEAPLATYQQIQTPRTGDAGLFRKALLGLSCRDYAPAEAGPEVFGLSPSSVSRPFLRVSAKQLQALLERHLEAYEFVALALDGKTFAEDAMVLALGITLTGEKVLLGFVQTATENKRVCAAFLPELAARELRLVNESAVKSLDEGFEETLTQHRLEVCPRLGVSLRRTNGMESILALVERQTARIAHRRTSDQKQRWLAAARLDVELRLHRIKGYRHLPLLRATFREKWPPQPTAVRR